MVGVKEDENKEEETTTVLVREAEKEGKKFPWRLMLIYLLLIVVGVFIGIVLRLALR